VNFGTAEGKAPSEFAQGGNRAIIDGPFNKAARNRTCEPAAVLAKVALLSANWKEASVSNERRLLC
jgi:hypothetical protein